MKFKSERHINPVAILSNINSKKSNNKLPKTCKICDRNIATSFNKHLLKHLHVIENKILQKIHLDYIISKVENQFLNEISNNKMQNQYSLDTNLHNKSVARFSCDICEKKYRDENSLSKHFLTHSKEKPYKCYFCGNQYKYENKCKSHIYRVHNDLIRFKSEPNQINKYIKYRTDLFLYNKNILVKNELKESNNNIKDTERNETNKWLEETNEDIKTKYNLRHKRVKPSNIFKCEVCKKSFVRKQYLEQHMQKYSCVNFQKNSIPKNEKKPELKKYFSDKDKYFRTFANGNIIQIGALKTEKETICKCSICFLEFNEKYINDHLKTHLNSEKSFSSKLCLKTYKTKNQLQHENKENHNPENQLALSIQNQF